MKTVTTHLVFPTLFDNEKNIFTSQVKALYCQWLQGKMWKQYMKMKQNYCAYILFRWSAEAKRANFQKYVQFMQMSNQTKD